MKIIINSIIRDNLLHFAPYVTIPIFSIPIPGGVMKVRKKMSILLPEVGLEPTISRSQALGMLTRLRSLTS